MGGAVLVPRDRGASSRFLDEQRLVERHEIFAVDRGGDRQQLRVAVDPEERLGELERAEDQVDDFRRGIGRRCGLGHLHRMPVVGLFRTAERVAQRLGPEQGRGLAAHPQRGPAPSVDRRALLDRQALKNVVEISVDVGQLVRAQHVLEDVEAATRERREDVRMQ